MHAFTAVVEKYNEQGEKTNWYYVLVPSAITSIFAKEKKAPFRIKGQIGNVAVVQLALWAIGNGDYIVPLNTQLRKKLGIHLGDTLALNIELDTSIVELNTTMLECIQQDELAWQRFQSLTPSFQRNFSRLVSDAKTDATQAKRISKIIRCLHAGDSWENMMAEWRKKD